MTHKRQFRELSEITKEKISQSLRGRCKTPTHIENISKGMRDKYWKTIHNKPSDSPLVKGKD